FTYGGLDAFAGEGPTAGMKLPDPITWAPMRTEDLIKSPKEAINVFDFEPVMRHNVPPAHFGYMASGVDDEVTLRANREGFLKFQLRPRRLVDVSKVDMSTEILGVKYNSPIIIAPVGGQKAFYSGGEIDVAKAAKVGNHLQILSTVTTSSVEDVTAARGQPIWYQLYATNKWEVPKAFVTRAEKAGCLAVAVTVDRVGGRNQEPLARLQRTDARECSACHDRSSLQSNLSRRPMYDGVDLTGLTLGGNLSSAMTWDFFKRLRDTTKMKIVIKGILAHEDAKLAADAGIDAIIVSNHGARSEDSGRSTIDALPEIVEAVGGRMPILIDSGFRRGTDVVKALCIGAQGVCIGRPYIWGLGAFGQPGVERVLELLRIELRAIMQQLGAPSIKHLTPAMVRRGGVSAPDYRRKRRDAQRMWFENNFPSFPGKEAVMGLLSSEELKQLLPAEAFGFPSPIPTQSVSSDEFMPAPQTARQHEFEARIKSYGGELARHQGMSRRAFFKTAAGMAAAFVAMNDTYGPIFAVSRAEAAIPEKASERAKKLSKQFIMDMHTHFLRDDTRIQT